MVATQLTLRTSINFRSGQYENDSFLTAAAKEGRLWFSSGLFREKNVDLRKTAKIFLVLSVLLVVLLSAISTGYCKPAGSPPLGSPQTLNPSPNGIFDVPKETGKSLVRGGIEAFTQELSRIFAGFISIVVVVLLLVAFGRWGAHIFPRAYAGMLSVSSYLAALVIVVDFASQVVKRASGGIT